LEAPRPGEVQTYPTVHPGAEPADRAADL